MATRQYLPLPPTWSPFSVVRDPDTGEHMLDSMVEVGRDKGLTWSVLIIPNKGQVLLSRQVSTLLN